MTKKELLTKLKDLQTDPDIESGHAQADGILLAYINDHEIAEAFMALERWYA